MTVSARTAARGDLAPIVDLYRGLEDEMKALHPMWPRMDGLPEPAEEALGEAISDRDSVLLIGEIDGFPLGFLLAQLRRSLPQADFEPVGSIELVYTDPEAREVGVAEAMRELALDILRRRGITKFDARVLPGHRLAKNFFEAGGFSARSIIMHHDDHPTERPARDPRRF
jgi:ribosomal protein S18 acetylase RimI-like enzyme